MCCDGHEVLEWLVHRWDLCAASFSNLQQLAEMPGMLADVAGAA